MWPASPQAGGATANLGATYPDLFAAIAVPLSGAESATPCGLPTSKRRQPAPDMPWHP